MKTVPPAGGDVRARGCDGGGPFVERQSRGNPLVKWCMGDFKVLVKQPDNYPLQHNYQASRFITLPRGLLGLIGMGDAGKKRDSESSEFSLNLPK